MDSFLALKFLSHLLLPPAATLVGVLIGAAALVCGWRRIGMTIIALAFVEMIVLSLPPVADALMAPLERDARLAAAEAPPCCYAAILVLGGGVYPEMPPDMPAPHLTDGVDRVWQAARLFHAGVAPLVIASGGRMRVEGSRQSEAEAMRQILIDLGVPAGNIVLEDASENTIENIVFVRRLVGDKTIALVTSAYHMPRALRLARTHGLKAAAFPTDWHVDWRRRTPWQNWLPTLAAASDSEIALREHAAALLDWRESPRAAAF